MEEKPVESSSETSEKVNTTPVNQVEQTNQPPAEPPAGPVVSDSRQPDPEPVAQPARRSRRGALIVGVLILLVVVAAVIYLLGKGNSSKSASNGTKGTKDVALIRYGMSTGPINSFYPDIEDSAVNYEVNRQIFEGLVTYQDQTKIVPQLATSWSNPDENTWVFNLRRGVKFHTGRTMTAKDVVASLQAAKKNDGLSAYNGTIKDVTANGDYQVKITTDGPDPILLNRLSAMYIFDSSSGVNNDPINGSGPYMLKPGTKPTDSSVDLVAFDQFHGGHVRTRELQLKWYQDQDQSVSDFNQGKLDLVGELDPGEFQKVRHGIRYNAAQEGLSFIQLNTLKTGSPVQKLAFRQALAYAINVNELIKVTGIPGKPANQLIPQDVPGYNPAAKFPAANIAKAKALLAQAGYPNGVTVTLTESDSPTLEIQEIIRELAQVGVTVKENNIPDFDQFVNALNDNSTEMSESAYTTYLFDGTDLLSLVTSPYNNIPQLDQLTNEAGQTTDPAKRLKLMQQAEKIVTDQVLIIPLNSSQLVYMTNKPYHMQQDIFSSTGVNFWKVYLP